MVCYIRRKPLIKKKKTKNRNKNKRSRSDLSSHGSTNSPSGLLQGLDYYFRVCYPIFKARTITNAPFDFLCGQKGETVLQTLSNGKLTKEKETHLYLQVASAQAMKPSSVVLLTKSYITKDFGPKKQDFVTVSVLCLFYIAVKVQITPLLKIKLNPNIAYNSYRL